MADLAERLAVLEERQHDLRMAFRDAHIRFKEVRAELKSIDREMDLLAAAVAKRVAENESGGVGDTRR